MEKAKRRSSVRGLGLICVFLLAACAPATSTATPQLVNVYASSAAGPWLSDLYHCPSSAVIRLSDPGSAEITIRLGAPADLSTPAFQIGTDDILVVVHPQVGVGSLTREQVSQLFIDQVTNWKDVGGNDLAVQVWSFSPDEDIQQFFDSAILDGRPVTSLARLAVSAQNMSDSVGSNPGSIGILPRRWKAGNTRDVFTAGAVPVLAITESEPTGVVRDLIACLQK